MEDVGSSESHWIDRHFRRYRQREPWDFCWRITIEATIVALTVIYILDIFGLAERKIPFSFPALMFIGVMAAPVFETLILQAFPVWIARLCKARFSVQVVCSVVPFAALHALEGVGTAIGAGLIGGFYYAFTYVHWRERSRWTAFWTTAISHAIRNAIAILLAYALGEL